jgi:hypothetical protein
MGTRPIQIRSTADAVWSALIVHEPVPTSTTGTVRARM